MAFNLNSLKPVLADTGAVLQLVHPKTEEVIEGMTITLLGEDSKVYRKLQLGKQQVALNRMAKGKGAIDLDAEKLSEDTIDDLVKITVAWSGFEDDGKLIECTPENVRAIYSDPYFSWIKEQAQEFKANRANFFRSSVEPVIPVRQARSLAEHDTVEGQAATA